MIDHKQLEDLKAKARAAQEMLDDYSNSHSPWRQSVWTDYLQASEPSAILSLIAELEQARKDVERLSHLETLLKSDKLDAERYREIRRGYAAGKVIELRKYRYAFKLHLTNYEYETFKTLDEAIDAAIAAMKGKKPNHEPN